MPTQEEVLAELRQMGKAGAVVKPLSEAPADIQAMAVEDAAAALNVKLPGRKPTPIWRVVGGGEFRYEDGEFACTIQDIRLDVFLAFTSQLQLYAEAVERDDTEVAMDALARAYVLLYHRPRWWERRLRKFYFLSTTKARNRMNLDLPARAILGGFLGEALAAYHAWVTGKKKANRVIASPDIPDTPKGSCSSPTNPESESRSS